MASIRKIIKVSLILLVIHAHRSRANSLLTLPQTPTKFNIASRALAKIIDHLSFSYQSRFTVTFIGESRHLNDVIDELMSVTNYSTFELKVYKELHQNFSLNDLIDHEIPNIVIFEQKYSDLGFLFPNLTESKLITYRKKMIYFYNLRSIKSRMLDNPLMKRALSEYPHDYCFLMHDPENDNSIFLLNNELFYNKTCQSYFHAINYFNSSKMQWRNADFFMSYDNFHNCTITKGYEIEASERFTRDRDNAKLVIYLDMITEIFAKMCNITFQNQLTIGQLIKFGEKRKKGKETPKLKENPEIVKRAMYVIFLNFCNFQDNQQNFSIHKGVEAYEYSPATYGDSNRNNYQEADFILSLDKFTWMIVRVTRGQKFTPMEKLMKNFDLETWITLMVTLIIALLVIEILKVLPEFIYKFVCGSNNNDPILNFVEIFFGLGLIV